MYKTKRIAFNKYFDTDYGDNLACRHCGLFHVTPESTMFYRMVAELRQYIGQSMPAISGCRCEFWNKHEKGAKESKHLKSIALDIAFLTKFYNYSPSRKREFLTNIANKWREICVKYGVRGGIGFYNNWFHIDSRPLEEGKKYMATWDYSDYFK